MYPIYFSENRYFFHGSFIELKQTEFSSQNTLLPPPEGARPESPVFTVYNF